MSQSEIYLILSVAFLGSISHCTMMCGGILGLQFASLKDKNWSRILYLSLSYNISRVFAYIVIGALFGAFGGILAVSHNARALLFFVLGLFLVFISIALFFRGSMLSLIENRWLSTKVAKMAMSLKHKFKDINLISCLLLGFLNGFLPCGLVYYFAASAILSASATKGALIMAIFGLSTMPTMIFLVNLLKFISIRLKDFMFKVAIFLIFMNGLYLSFSGFKAFNG